MVCGGVERTLLNLLGSLDREKYKIDLLLLEKKGEFLDMVPEDVRVLEADMPLKWRTILMHSGCTLKEGFRAIWKQGMYGIAFSFMWVKLWNRISCKLCKRSTIYSKCVKNIKPPREHYDIVCDYHGYGHLTTYLTASFKDAKRFSWIHVDKIDDAFVRAHTVYPQFDAFFGVSPKCLTNFGQTFPEIAPEKLVLLYNFIPKDQIHQLSKRAPSVAYPADGRFVMVSVGRLSTQKGFDLALDAAHILKQHGRKFLWIIVGEGPERTNLEAQIAFYGLEQDVILHGLDNNPYAYMALADLYVQSSRFEGFATTLSESIILGKPIVSTSFSGVDQQVVEGKNGTLAAFDKNDLATKIEQMMDDENLRLAYGKGCSDIKLPMDETLETLEQWFN